MPVYFIQRHQIHDKKIVVTGDLVHHLLDVLRVRIGEAIDFVDEGQYRYRSRILAKEGRSLIAEILTVAPRPTPPALVLHLAQGIPKGDKMESIIQKGTELGVDRLTPLIMERCVVQWKAERSASRIDRWRKIALEAAQQSGRWSIPEVDGPQPFPEFLDHAGNRDLSLILWEGESGRRLTPLIDAVKRHRQTGSSSLSCLVVIGPEGGISPTEIAYAEEKGLTPVTLGERILRTETAALAVLGMIQYAVGDMG